MPITRLNKINSRTKSVTNEIANRGRKIARPIVIATTAKPMRVGIGGGAPSTESGLRLRHKVNPLTLININPTQVSTPNTRLNQPNK